MRLEVVLRPTGTGSRTATGTDSSTVKETVYVSGNWNRNTNRTTRDWD